MLSVVEESAIAGNSLSLDLEYILDQTRHLWDELRGNRVFITGGTGFFGCWLLESFAWANHRLGLGASVGVLTRNPAAFARKVPDLVRDPAIRLHEGDVRSFDFPAGDFRFVIHAAGDANQQSAAEDPILTKEIIVDGTRHILEFARQCGAAKLLITSSGAIYGKQPIGLTHMPEGYEGGPDPLDPRSAYGESKRMAELLCAIHAQRNGLECKIARCFAFAGPYLPTDGHFAFGSFLRDAMRGNPIGISGDGTPRRSYLYAADLAVWLWTILFRGETCRPYNVGSERDVSIFELANQVAQTLNPTLGIEVAREPIAGRPAQRYVPSTHRAQTELGLRESIGLTEAIKRTAQWHRLRGLPVSA